MAPTFMRRSARWHAAGTLLCLGLLGGAVVACRRHPTPTPLAPPTIAAPQGIGGAAGTPATPAAGALPTPTTFLPLDLSATATAIAETPRPTDLIDKRLEGGVVGRTYRLNDVRTGEHPGFTRIVWAMDEAAGAPRWTTLLRRDAEGTAVIDLTLADDVGRAAHRGARHYGVAPATALG